MTFTETMAKLRTGKGETQGQLADILGVSNRTVSKWECGDGEPDMATLIKIAEHYGVTLDKLCGIEETQVRDYADLSVDDAALQAYSDMLKCTNALQAAFESNDDKGVDFSKLDSLVPPHLLDENAHATGVFTSRIYSLFVNSHANNFSVTVMRNAENFKWITEQSDKLTKFFSYLTDPDILKLLYTLLASDFARNFTADYAAEAAGISTEKAVDFLDYAGFHFKNVELIDGKCKIYQHLDATLSGSWLAILCLAHELAINEDTGYDGYFKTLYNPILAKMED